MATTCPNCGSKAPEAERVCAACGWDPVSRKLVGKPAGLDLFFKPVEPAPRPASEEAKPASRPIQNAPPPIEPAAASAQADSIAASRAEPPEQTEFPAILLDPLLELLQRTEAGRGALRDPRGQAVAAALRKPGIFVATVLGFGALGLGTLHFLLWSAEVKVVPLSAPVPAAAVEYVRPSATFAGTPKVVVNSWVPGVAPEPAPTGEPQGVPWIFQGRVFDLLTTRGVSAAVLIFMDANGNAVGETVTDADGRYKISIPPGIHYAVKIVHGGYGGRYIDDDDAKRFSRARTAEGRRAFLQAPTRNFPWAGNTANAVERDLALVPRSPDHP
jgi:hypothetical protein